MTIVDPSIRPRAFDKLRELLRLIAALRGMKEPLTSPDGLRQALEILLQLAGFAGLDPAVADRLRTILADERVFANVLAIVQYIAGLLALSLDLGEGRVRLSSAGNGAEVFIEAADFFDWLPIVLEIIELLRRLLGE